MKLNIVFKPTAIKALTGAQRKAALMTAEQMYHELVTTQVMPFDEGTLQNIQTNIGVSKDHGGTVEIVHDTPYAARLYFHPEYNFSFLINRNAQGMWWEDWISGSKKKRAATLFRHFYSKEASRYVK